ncbi:conserved protein of unknown function [Sterolibacterium denitrificans]|uniref:DUF2889 domain-containing protein n=1 Tax=Sterolibacterium denitrificans TaxID=157592 RepID=A0A7Z7HPF8_9PROT|nr:DUF2889 domain-containing protein [Sterolibacterium denitrificans]SMB22682.1 conserved protein of unknown function [Sterolibacterium denitrificans]
MGTPNTNYGSGVFRRRLHWQATPGCVAVALEDSNHGFRLRLRHDGRQITAVEAEPVRHPFTTCPEAVSNVQQISGLALADAAGLRARLPQATNCTHLVDMALLAASHAGAARQERHYDIAVADERDGLTAARITCDGQPIHAWTIRNHVIETPAELAGRPVMRGFYAWAAAQFGETNDLALEAAQLLQRGYFVAQARRSVYLPVERYPARSDGMTVGACYSYNTGAVERALRIHGSVRDYSKSAERLLQFDGTAPCGNPTVRQAQEEKN